jgi:hypothetical protein
VADQKRNPKFKDQGCDNVLRGQVCGMSHGTVVDGSEAMMEYWLAGKNRWITILALS